MFDTITIALIILTLSALAMAGFAVFWLSRVKSLLSDLAMRVLESEDIGKIKEAANKIGTFESRVSGCEQKASESKYQLAENKTKLNELAEKLRASEQKTASTDARFSELFVKLESVEQMAVRNEEGLTQTVPNIKVLADEIQNLKIFRAATEKARGLILEAFNDMQAGVSPEEFLTTLPQAPKTEAAQLEESSQEPEEWQKEDKDQKLFGSCRWQS